MAIKVKYFREWLADRLPFKGYRERWQRGMKAARVSLRSVSKRLPWSRSLTRKGILYLSLLLMAAVTVSGIFYLAYGIRPMGEPEPWEDLKELDAVTGAPPGQLEQSGEVEVQLPPEEGAATGGEEVEAVTAEPVLVSEESVEGEEEAAGEVAALVEEELPPLPGKPINPVIAPLAADFGWRQHPALGDWRYHTGIDSAAPLDTPVQAVLDGVVAAVYQDPLLGQVVVLTHGSHWESRYSHCQDVRAEVGSYVAQGEVIALVGESDLYPESHLHFELRCNGQAVDPLEYLPDPERMDGS